MPPTPQHNAIYHWITQGWPDVGDAPHPDAALRLIWAFERAQRATSAQEVVTLIRDYDLPREALPTEMLREASVWEALLARMPLEAMVRNLATMTTVGLLAPNSAAARTVTNRLDDAARIVTARLHPIKVLAALSTYALGYSERSSKTWTPVRTVVDALDTAFYHAFGAVAPTGKRYVLGIDISGSMQMGSVSGVSGLTPQKAAAAMAMVTTRTEPQTSAFGFDRQPRPLNLSPKQRLDVVTRQLDGWQGGSTDCAQPMLHALEQGIAADVFVVLTDNETWSGSVHPSAALKRYRAQTGIPAKLIVIGMTSTGFSISDPNDAGSLDCVGFDTAVPEVMASFVRDASGSAA